MKKLLVLFLTGTIFLSLAACGGENKNYSNDEPNNVSEETEDEIVKKINMVYGDDEKAITLTKPENAEFTMGTDDPDNAGDLVGICADDYSWDAEIMGYKYYEGIGSNVPFVDYYFADSVNEEEYTAYEQEITDIGIEYEGNPVQIIRYTYKEVDDEKSYSECFVGFEYKGADDCGLMGLKITSPENELSDDYLKNLFMELFLSVE